MKIQHVLAILLRLSAIIVLLYAIRLSIWIMASLPAEGPHLESNLIFAGASTLALFAVALCGWFLPMFLAKIIVKPAWDKPVNSISAPALLKVLVIFLGLYFFFGRGHSTGPLCFPMVVGQQPGGRVLNAKPQSLARGLCHRWVAIDSGDILADQEPLDMPSLAQDQPT